MSRTGEILIIYNDMPLEELYVMNVYGTEFVVEDGLITGVMHNGNSRRITED